MNDNQQDDQGQDEAPYPEHIAEALTHIESLKLSGEHEKSIKEAQKLLCNDPNCVNALEEIADNYVSLNDFKRAEKACQCIKILVGGYPFKVAADLWRSVGADGYADNAEDSVKVAAKLLNR